MSNLLKVCPACKGLPLNPITIPGEDGEGSIPQVCAVCNDTHVVPGGRVEDSDIRDLLYDVLNKCNDIFEKVNE